MPDLVIISAVALALAYYLQLNYEKSDRAFNRL